MICTTANALWLAGCVQEAARFARATRQARLEQERVLLRVVRANRDTEFGREHGFSDIHTAHEFQARVPVRSYDEYTPYIDRLAAGALTVLTREPVRLFEPTSGSASATKLIPYPASLQREFQRGIQPWIADLFLHRPDLMRGQAYWSVSPATSSNRRTSGGIPIGFEDDSHYVGGWRRRLVQAVMAVPPALRHVAEIDTFQHLTLLSLVRSGSLRIISVWNPTFLLVLLDRLTSHAEALVRDLHGDTHRQTVLRRALRAATPAERHAILWPDLGLISCWADANASEPSAALSQLFPLAEMQGKGLIATEGFVSFPKIGYDGAALSIRSHFFEFAPLDFDQHGSTRTPLLAHELERGRQYEIILTTAGGLYRYRLGDVVEVVDYLRTCPLITFVGRHSYVSDWYGEKLHEAHVARVMQEALATSGISARFAMLACDRALDPPAYVAYLEPSRPTETLDRLGPLIDTKLRDNFHYNHARALGQLAPVRVFRTEGGGRAYLNEAVRAGQRAGDVKPLALDRRDGWSSRFPGQFV